MVVNGSQTKEILALTKFWLICLRYQFSLATNSFFFSLLKSFHTIEAKLSDKLFPFKYQRDMISSVKVCRDLNKGIGEKNKTLIRGAIIVFRKKMVWEDERNI